MPSGVSFSELTDRHYVRGLGIPYSPFCERRGPVLGV